MGKQRCPIVVIRCGIAEKARRERDFIFSRYDSLSLPFLISEYDKRKAA